MVEEHIRHLPRQMFGRLAIEGSGEGSVLCHLCDVNSEKENGQFLVTLRYEEIGEENLRGWIRPSREWENADNISDFANGPKKVSRKRTCATSVNPVKSSSPHFPPMLTKLYR